MYDYEKTKKEKAAHCLKQGLKGIGGLFLIIALAGAVNTLTIFTIRFTPLTENLELYIGGFWLLAILFVFWFERNAIEEKYEEQIKELETEVTLLNRKIEKIEREGTK